MALMVVFLAISPVFCVPFVTKRVSLHNPIAIDFSGWRPLETTNTDKAFLTIPVAVETDQNHELTEQEIEQIRDRVINNWRQRPLKEESFAHMRPLVTSLLPRPELEVETRDDDHKNATLEDVKRDASETPKEETVFHAYVAPRTHSPPEGYVRLSRAEFGRVFGDAELLVV